VEPDSIPDLYDTEYDDEDYAQFLFNLKRDCEYFIHSFIQIP